MAFSEANTWISITTPLGADKLLLQRFYGEETMSGLFLFDLEMTSEDPALDATQIVGKAATITMTIDSATSRYISGIVARFVQAGKDGRFTTYHAQLRPWLWLMTMNADCKIYQNKSTSDILTAVFSDLSFTDTTNSLTATYSPREYCVQYQESTFAFVSRLMEDEGIYYFFDHSSSTHKLVMGDDTSGYKDIPGTTTIQMQQSAVELKSGTVQECTIESAVTTGQYKATDFNFETPATSLLSTASGADTKRSIYEYPGYYRKSDAGDARTSLRLAEHEVPGKVLRGKSNCAAFTPGCKFTLAGHYRADVNAAYVLTRVSHQASHTSYSNSFEAIPATVVCHPPRVTPRHLILGSQTATVTGKSGEEIWTDKYGRVVVQFHWDQLGTNDENSSCWIRVAQGWAGKQWGSIFIPRIGQEVVVGFLDGNPDRPLITGSVYNAQQTVPYTLPDEQTKSTVKSNSSKGGSGFNEIRFEDKASSEEIFIQAQKDMNVNVLNNLTTTVTKDSTLTTSGNDKYTVTGTRDVKVTGAETHTNEADYTQKVTGNFSLTVDGNLTIDIKGSVSIKSGTSFDNNAGTALTNKAGTTLTNQSGTDLNNKAGTTMSNQAQISIESKASAQQTIDGGGMLTLKGGLVKIN